MRSLFAQLKHSIAVVCEVFAVGQAFGDGRLTTAQTSDAIARAGHRNELFHLDRGVLTEPSAPSGELIDAR